MLILVHPPLPRIREIRRSAGVRGGAGLAIYGAIGVCVHAKRLLDIYGKMGKGDGGLDLMIVREKNVHILLGLAFISCLCHKQKVYISRPSDEYVCILLI